MLKNKQTKKPNQTQNLNHFLSLIFNLRCPLTTRIHHRMGWVITKPFSEVEQRVETEEATEESLCLGAATLRGRRCGDGSKTAQEDRGRTGSVWEHSVFVTGREKQIPIKRCEIRHRRRVSLQRRSLWIKLDLLLMKPLNPSLFPRVCVCLCLLWYYSAIVGSVSPYHRLRSFAVDATQCSL